MIYYPGEKCNTDIDECAGALCSEGSTCIDEVNQYSCSCPPGYAGRYWIPAFFFNDTLLHLCSYYTVAYTLK